MDNGIVLLLIFIILYRIIQIKFVRFQMPFHMIRFFIAIININQDRIFVISTIAIEFIKVKLVIIPIILIMEITSVGIIIVNRIIDYVIQIIIYTVLVKIIKFVQAMLTHLDGRCHNAFYLINMILIKSIVQINIPID